MNNINHAEIHVPEYNEAKWMDGASLNYMQQALEGIGNGFDWSKTEQGEDYWKTVYKKLYIMCKHMEVYSVMKRLNGGNCE